MDPYELFIDPRYEFVRVCLEHGGLYDTKSHRDTGYRQSCHDRTAQPRWDRFDFNEWIHLCDCCLSESVPSGSKWSPFFCSMCLSTIRESNVGIPIGRHSLMNRIVLQPDGLDGFAGALNAMSGAIERLGAWKIQQIRALGVTEDSLYLEELYDLTYEGVETAVERLIAWWTNDEPDDDYTDDGDDFIIATDAKSMVAKWKAEHEARQAEEN